MSNYVEVASKAGDRYLESLAATQEGYLKYLAAWTPYLPRAKAYTGTLPMRSMLSVRDMAGAWFAFSEKLLSQQKAYSDKLLAATMPAKPATAADSSAGSKKRRSKTTRTKRATSKPASARSATAKKVAAKAARASSKKSATNKPAAKVSKITPADTAPGDTKPD